MNFDWFKVTGMRLAIVGGQDKLVLQSAKLGKVSSITLAFFIGGKFNACTATGSRVAPSHWRLVDKWQVSSEVNETTTMTTTTTTTTIMNTSIKCPPLSVWDYIYKSGQWKIQILFLEV